ncbi:hypothetical protein [Cellulomonas sp. URHB0016]
MSAPWAAGPRGTMGIAPAVHGDVRRTREDDETHDDSRGAALA